MKACASLPAIVDAAYGAVSHPVVLVNGVPEPGLIVREWRAVGPLDRRRALIKVDTVRGVNALAGRLAEATVTLASAHRLVDGEVRWAVLLHGRFVGGEVGLAAGDDRHELGLEDFWGLRLEESLRGAWWQTDNGLVFDDKLPAVIRVGRSANRSDRMWWVGGNLVYVFQDGGLPWSVSDALEMLSALAGIHLSLRMIPREIGDQPLLKAVDLRRSIGEALAGVLSFHGLVVQRDLVRESGLIVEKRAIRPVDRGRKISLAWADTQRPHGQVLRVKADRSVKMARQWIGRVDGWRVESTVELVNGWDSLLDGESDATYSKTNNSNFDVYANVFRLWVLNEDGHFSQPPYNQGAAFDLSVFFGQGAIQPTPLRFLPTLTLDDTGVGRSPIVEMSTDGGVNWLVYPGVVKIRNDRAAVYLDDPTLPLSFLSAAKTGSARIRVTASLRSPVPVQESRWTGNPFKGTRPAKVFDLGGGFRFQRVASGSIYFDDIVNGSLAANEFDETHALNDWLIDQIRLADTNLEDKQGRSDLVLVGAWPGLRVGDCLVNTSGSGLDAGGCSEAVVARGAVVQSMRCRWSDGRVSDGRNRGNGLGRAPVTEVELIY